MRYICSGHGFFVSRDFNVEERTHEFTFSESIQQAHHFGSKKQALQMLKYMEEAGFAGFYYNPKAEAAYKDLYSVVVSEGPTWYNEDQLPKGVSYIRKETMVNYSDKDFLSGEIHPLKKFFSKEVAEAMANEANEKLMEWLKNKNGH